MMRYWILLIFVSWSLAGCLQGYDHTIDYRNRFFDRLKTFNAKRNQIKSSFTIVFSTLEQKLQSPHPNFGAIASEWNSRLNSLTHRIDALREELKKMDTLAKSFYSQLDKLTLEIKDSVVKVREKNTNHEHLREWKKWRAYAERNMNRAYKAIKLGRDAHKVFIASGIRTKRDLAIKTLREVRHELFSSMRRLERFANSTMLLVSLEYEGLVPDEIKKMQDRRKDVVEKLTNIAKIMQRQLNDKDKPLHEISWAWESEYADMRYELEALSDDFANVKTLTKTYYDKSAYHIEKIVSPTLREEEIEAQKAHQAKLDKIYVRIDEIRDEISQNFRFADDAYQMLINAARRRQIGSATEKLRDIRIKIDKSLKNLEYALGDLADLFTSEKQKAKRKK